jgi:acetyl-CoA C-acetyltransferase
MADAFIVDALRTAGGRRGGALKDWHPVDLGAAVLDALVERAGIDPSAIDDVIVGCVGQIGEQAFHVGRNMVLASSLPDSVPAVSIDRQCGSSQQSVHFAAQAVMSGTQDLVIAAGVESMTRVPMGTPVILPMQAGIGTGPWPRSIQDRYGVSEFTQFRGAEMMASKYGLAREQLDEFALESHRKAAAATQAGAFDREIVPLKVNGGEHRSDEGIRYDASLEALAGLKTLVPDGVITAGNASQVCDGSAAVLVASERAVNEHGLTPLARIDQLTVTAGDPVIMLDEPIRATRTALGKSGRSHRGHRPLRSQRSLRSRPAGLAAAARRRSRAPQREWRRDRARPSAGRIGHQADGDAGPRAPPPAASAGACRRCAKAAGSPTSPSSRRCAALKLVDIGQRHHRMVGPGDRKLLLRVEPLALVGKRCCGDFVLAQMLAWSQREHVEPAGDLGP